jgi:hypothetical protein
MFSIYPFIAFAVVAIFTMVVFMYTNMVSRDREGENSCSASMQGPEWDPICFARPFIIPLDTIQEEV